MLYLTQKQIDKILEHSKKESPNEACGILAGRFIQKTGQIDKRVEKVYQMTNIDKSTITFFMDPKEQLKVMKEIRNLGLEMVGIYHSHPKTEAYPSAHDVELAFYPEVSYLIVSVRNSKAPVVKSFRIQENKVIEEEVVVSEFCRSWHKS